MVSVTIGSVEHEDRSGGRVPLLLSRGRAFPATAVQHVRLSGPIHRVGILYRPHSSIVGSARSRVWLVFTTGLANMAGRKPWKLISLDHRTCTSRCHSPIQGFLPAMAGVWGIDLGGALEFGNFRSTDGLQPSKKVPGCLPFSGGTNSCTHARVSDLDSAIEMLENAELGRSTARPGGKGHSISSNPVFRECSRPRIGQKTSVHSNSRPRLALPSPPRHGSAADLGCARDTLRSCCTLRCAWKPLSRSQH